MNIVKLLIIFFGLLFISCGKKLYVDSAESTIINGSENGIVSISSYGYANGIDAAELDAIKMAFNTIFFIGFADNKFVSDLKKPFFDHEPNLESDFFVKFFESKKFLSYITSQKKAEIVKDRTSLKFSNSKGTKCVKKEITVNYKSLRKYLEDQGVLRKGFSF